MQSKRADWMDILCQTFCLSLWSQLKGNISPFSSATTDPIHLKKNNKMEKFYRSFVSFIYLPKTESDIHGIYDYKTSHEV